jgi:hypothetical protein
MLLAATGLAVLSPMLRRGAWKPSRPMNIVVPAAEAMATSLVAPVIAFGLWVTNSRRRCSASVKPLPESRRVAELGFDLGPVGRRQLDRVEFGKARGDLVGFVHCDRELETECAVELQGVLWGHARQHRDGRLIRADGRFGHG